MRALRSISIEIVELVIDLLYHWHDGDLVALKSCSLTCRTLMARARYWIAQQVKMTFGTEDELTECNEYSIPFGTIRKGP